MPPCLTARTERLSLSDGPRSGCLWVGRRRRLVDISDAYLDLNLGKVNWKPREAGKVGAGHLESKVAKGSGQFGKDKADFWHVATGFDGKTYALVVIAGIKSSAEPKVREEMTPPSARFKSSSVRLPLWRYG